MKTMYRAGRSNEEPGIEFQATDHRAAKAYASRQLEAGAFQGQLISLVEIVDGMRTDRVWKKAAGYGKWVSYGDA